MHASGGSLERPVLEVRNLEKHYVMGGAFPGRSKHLVRAVDGVSFSIARSETLGLVGESGCGKSTLARVILRLTEASGGEIVLDGEDLSALDAASLRARRRIYQVVFQDPYASLNPRMSARDIVAEGLDSFGLAGETEREALLVSLFEKVGLKPEQMNRHPHEFSGGQRQRLGIARALAVNPRLIICDEAVSALDVSVKAQILNLFMDLQEEMGFSYLFISHDLAVVEHVSDRVAVMYLGRIVEIADKAALYSDPRHPYTRALLDAIPIPDPTKRRNRQTLSGDLPSPSNPPRGCSFHPRCPMAIEKCRSARPEMRQVGPDHAVACHLY